jgi:tetratricopeptide (TPR) repeat protein
VSTGNSLPERGHGLFAKRMTELMQADGRSFRALGAAVSADPGHLNKVANGARPVPGPSLVAAIDRVLHADGHLVELARREAAPAPPAPVRALGDAEEKRARATTAHLVALDTLHGSDGLVPVATRAFRAAADQLAVVGGTADVRSAVADLGTAAAWIAADATERDQSRAVALEALALADLAGDKRLHQFLLSHLSMVSEHAGRHGDALAYAERILAEAPDNPRVMAMVQVRRARALSGLGAHTEALAAWEHAEHMLTESPSSGDGLTYWIDDAEMAIHRAVIASRAGARDAVDWAHRGVDWLAEAQGRDQVLFRAMLLDNAVQAHAWREVPIVVDDLLKHAGAGRSARVPELLDRIWQSIAGQRVPPAVRDAVRAAREAF